MIKEFMYTSSNGTKPRKVFVIKENDAYIGGIDLNLLSEEDASTISNIYKDVAPISDFKSKVILDGFDQAWLKAYRQFTKSKIQQL